MALFYYFQYYLVGIYRETYHILNEEKLSEIIDVYHFRQMNITHVIFLLHKAEYINSFIEIMTNAWCFLLACWF